MDAPTRSQAVKMDTTWHPTKTLSSTNDSGEQQAAVPWTVSSVGVSHTSLRLLYGPSLVLLKEQVEQFDAGCRTNRPALYFPKGVESMARIDIQPAICVQDGSIEFCMKFPHPCRISIC